MVTGRQSLRLTHLVLDVHGTLTFDGQIIPGVEMRISRLRRILDCRLLTADTHGTAVEVARTLGCLLTRLVGDDQAGQKAAHVRELGSISVVAIGNGANDALMLREAAPGVG